MLIETFKIFCDIVNFKSFSRAAEANYITQPAVSRQISNLERAWKVVLLERDNKKIHLTHAGEILYQKAKLILEQYEELVFQLKQTTESVSGKVRVAAIHGVGMHELPPYVQRYIKLCPNVKVSLEYMQDSLVYHQVIHRRADIGIVAFPNARSNLKVIPFRNDELGIVCHPNHPLAKFKSATLTKIKGEKFVAFNKGIPTRKVLDEFLQKHKIPINISMEFDNIETLKRAVEINVGISILPLVTVRQEVERGALKAVGIKGKPLYRSLGILVQESRNLSSAVTKFIDLLAGQEGI